MRNDYLKIIFYKKMSAYASDKALINQTFENLLRLYDHSKRFYHDSTHVVDLLNQMEARRVALKDEETIYLAIWFHDAVYLAGKPDNEEKSAELAKNFLTQTQFPAFKMQKVVDYILATKTHGMSEDSDLNYFLDFDLSILGAEDLIYDIYSQQIREEYGFYPSFLYDRGRKKVLKAFLERDFIYKTDEFRDKYEAKARENIQRELDGF
jgi:predicted metal-dependent HD superfamily phosphohydrolase